MSLNAVSHGPIIRLEMSSQLPCPFFIQRHVHFPWSSPFTSFQAQDVADDFLGKVSNFSLSALRVYVLILREACKLKFTLGTRSRTLLHPHPLPRLLLLLLHYL